MKKIFKMAMGVVCATSMMAFVGCGGEDNAYTTQETLNGKTAEEKYNEIMTTVNNQSGNFTSTVNYDVHCTANVDGMSINMDLQLNSIVKMNGDNFYASDYLDAGSFMGMELGTITSNVWYVDGTAYLDSVATGEMEGSILTTKMKMTVTMAELCEAAGLDQETLFNPIYDFAETSFEEVTFSVGANDSYFEIVMAGDEAAAYAETILAKQGMEGDFVIPQVNYKFIMDNEGNFQNVKIAFEVTANIQGETYQYAYDGTINFSDIGTTVVTAPEGSETWFDATPESDLEA